MFNRDADWGYAKVHFFLASLRKREDGSIQFIDQYGDWMMTPKREDVEKLLKKMKEQIFLCEEVLSSDQFRK